MKREILALLFVALWAAISYGKKGDEAGLFAGSVQIGADASEQPFIMKMNAMPANFLPSAEEQPIRETAREQWIAENIAPGEYKFHGTLERAESVSAQVDGAEQTDKDHPSGEQMIMVRIDCGSGMLWGSKIKLTVSAKIAGVTAGDAAGWETGKSMVFWGKVAMPDKWSAPFGPTMELSMAGPLEIAYPALAATQPASAALEFSARSPPPPPVANAYTKFLNTMPAELWPVKDESQARSQLRAVWVQKNIPGRATQAELRGKLTEATAVKIPVTQDVMYYDQSEGLRPVIKTVTTSIDGVQLKIACGPQHIWGMDVDVTASAVVSNVSIADVNRWGMDKTIAISGVASGVPENAGAASSTLEVTLTSASAR